MRKLFLGIVALCAVYSAQAIKIIHGPYLQAVTDTEATVVWVTDTDALSWVEVAPEDGTHFYQESRQKYYQTYLVYCANSTLTKVCLIVFLSRLLIEMSSVLGSHLNP